MGAAGALAAAFNTPVAAVLYIGAMAGGVVGVVMNRLAPFPSGDPGAYALVGMGTLFAGIIRAPMTSVFMIFEITQDYQILVPLMVANMLSFAISRRYQPTPVYHALLQQDNVHLPSATPRVAPTQLTARDVMSPDAQIIPADSSIAAAWEIVSAEGGSAYLVGGRDELVGILDREALAEAVKDGRGAQLVSTLVDTELPHVHPDHPLDIVVERFGQSPGLLAVVGRDHARRLEGIITPDTLTRRFKRRPVDPRAEGGASSPTGLDAR